MAGNYASQLLATRLRGLGSALLDQIRDGGSDYAQSVMQPVAGGSSSAALDAMAQSELHAHADNRIALDITTASGTKVEVTLGSQDDGLAVQVEVGGGTLTAAERDAIGKLADSFQDAIDGLAANPPSLDLGGLTQFDPQVLSSVSLHASVKPDGSDAAQTVDFLADGQQRSVTASGPSGTVQVDVDMADRAILGSPAQQAQAVDSYLAQFDSAQARGQGDVSLMALFKSAFAQMNSTYGTAPPRQPAAASNPVSLNAADRSMLSGLADFSASVTQSAKSGNPMRADEPDSFSYQVSQATRISGSSQLDRAIAQQQHSRLSASYRQSLTPGMPLDLTGSKQSQNYYYNQINDDADSQADLEYSNGILVKAALEQSASQSRHTSKYVMGQRVEDTTTPSRASRSWNLLDLLKPIQQSGSAKTAPDSHRAMQGLSAIGKLVLLKAVPLQLRDETLP